METKSEPTKPDPTLEEVLYGEAAQKRQWENTLDESLQALRNLHGKTFTSWLRMKLENTVPEVFCVNATI